MSAAANFAPRPDERVRASRRTVAVLTIIWGGMMVSESIYMGLLPLTLSRFTTDVALIGWILAIKPALSIVVQPAAGIITDRIWTRVGRRALFLILFAPALGFCLYVLPGLTHFWQVVIAAALFQFFQDVLWGSDHPLLADLIPAPQRTSVMGWMMTSSQVVAFLFLWIGMGVWLGKGVVDLGWLAKTAGGVHLGWLFQRHDEAFVYRFGAILQTILVAGMAFFLGEKPVVATQRPKLTLRRYVADFWGDPILRKFGALGFTQVFFQNLVTGFVSLFAVKTLLLSPSEFGEIWKWQALVAIAAFMVGPMVEHRPKQWVMACGYGLSTLSCLIGYFAKDGEALLVVAVIFGLGQVVGNTTLKPFFTEYVPRDIVGQISGSFNTCVAVARMLALGVGGMLVKLLADDASDYRSIWVMAFIMGLATIAACLAIPDRRYDERKRAAAAAEGFLPPLPTLNPANRRAPGDRPQAAL